MTNSDVTLVCENEFGCRGIGGIVAETTCEWECSGVVAHSLRHASCSPHKIPDATATSLIHPWDTSGTQNSETTIQQTSACPRPQPSNGNTVRTAICWNRMPPTPLSEPLWNFQQSTHGRALSQRLHNKGTPDRGMEHKDRSLTLSPSDAIRPRWMNLTKPHIKPLQEQNLLDLLTTAAFETKVPHDKPLHDRNHCQGEPLNPPPPLVHGATLTNAHVIHRAG
jgi:hypothetical protein